jgi:hypothetical protein
MQDGMKDMKFVGRVVYDKGDIKFEGLSSDFVRMLMAGIRDMSQRGRPKPKIFPADGIKFLHVIAEEFGRGSYFRVGDVEEVKV